MLESMRLQRVRHNLVTKQQATTRKKGGGRAGPGPQTVSLSAVFSLASYSLSTGRFSHLFFFFFKPYILN